MFTYQARPRVFRSRSGGEPVFPCTVELTLTFQPLQPFGMMASGGLTTVQDVKARICFDANTGQHSVEAEHPLAPIRAKVDVPPEMIWNGNCLTVSVISESWESVQDLAGTLYFGIPLLLGVEFIDPPRVERLQGVAGGIPFTWELSPWSMSMDVTTQVAQVERVTRACEQLVLLTNESNSRLVAALHYFHTACRLRREAKTPGEFLAESLLNLNRALEVLYGPRRENVRAALVKLGYPSDEVERDFIPVMLLRNSMDVGHPSLARLKPEQLRTLHRYADHAEHRFRLLLQRLLKSLASGQSEIMPYESTGPDPDLVRTIDTLRKNLGN